MEGSQPKPGIYLPQKTTESSAPENKAVARAIIRSTSSDYVLSVKRTGAKFNGRRLHSASRYWSHKQVMLTPQFTASLNRSSDDSTSPARPLELRLSAKVTETRDTMLPSVLSPISSSPPDEGVPAQYHSRQYSRELSSALPGAEPTPHFLSIQSIFGPFRKRHSLPSIETTTRETTARTTRSTLVQKEPEDRGWKVSPGRKIVQRRMSLPVALLKQERESAPPDLLKYISKLPVIGGLEAVLAYPGQGIPREHLVELAETCSVYHLVLGIRPFPETATQLALDNARSKPLSHKQKSASWGVQAPYLTDNQEYGKLFDAPAHKLKKFQKYADEWSDKAVQLRQADQQLKRLQMLKLPGSDVSMIEQLEYTARDQITFQCRPSPGHLPYFYRGSKTEDGDWLIDIQEDGEFVPLKVVPLIPDYDLCFLYSLQEELDLAGKDKVPVPDISPDEIRQRLARLEGKTLSEQSKAEFAKIQLEVQSLKSFLQKMDQVLGNLTKQEEHYLHTLNYAIGRTGLNPMFHHGADNNNPVSDLDTNFPLTVVLPRFIEPLKERYYIIEDEKQLKAFINLLKDNSYYAPTNPAWGSIHRVRSKSFRRYSAVTGEPMISKQH
ncbi:CyaA/EF/ExoY family adenylyl cyclase toxin [Endozoicomonas gorgoniicola]|uniref:CyaA/EF/ExoY family adenylyl cyclase toxin n=1 Tax=Endozoicomonas gorgoniicola TaxID=1234144 RepID=A0ABT3MQB8_9GAMM|nr:CyaA/EF/ExoY family adenylyl cyclase toxin [Endozoicomonas gorgoniicola]MCW7551308.1 CyaA/EF/ExoY family adenylyl cyclase toxin [Endozoicomonas gorgoniicola]